MFATTSLNGVIGHAALIVGLAASVFGALGLGIATATGDRTAAAIDHATTRGWRWVARSIARSP